MSFLDLAFSKPPRVGFVNVRSNALLPHHSVRLPSFYMWFFPSFGSESSVPPFAVPYTSLPMCLGENGKLVLLFFCFRKTPACLSSSSREMGILYEFYFVLLCKCPNQSDCGICTVSRLLGYALVKKKKKKTLWEDCTILKKTSWQ